jgi:hypothetical protein
MCYKQPALLRTLQFADVLSAQALAELSGERNYINALLHWLPHVFNQFERILYNLYPAAWHAAACSFRCFAASLDRAYARAYAATPGPRAGPRLVDRIRSKHRETATCRYHGSSPGP